MTVGIVFLAYLVALFIPSQIADVYVDMTHDFDNQTTVYWPTAQSDRFTLSDAGSVDSDNPDRFYTAYKFRGAEHGGTHVDAPKHFAKGKHATHEIPLQRLIGAPYIVDASTEASNDRDFKVSGDFLSTYTASHGKVPANSILLVYTGWSKKWSDVSSYLGTTTTNTSLLHFPGLDKSGAEWILANTQTLVSPFATTSNFSSVRRLSNKIKSLGIDTASVDYGQSTTYGAHRLLAAMDIPFFENVDNIDQILGKEGVTIYALPMKIKSGSGGPVRIIAVYNNRPRTTMSSWLLIALTLILVICLPTW